MMDIADCQLPIADFDTECRRSKNRQLAIGNAK